MTARNGNERLDPVTGEVVLDPVGGGGGGGRGGAGGPYIPSFTGAQFGAPLPIVYGTAKCPGQVVFLRPNGNGAGWIYNGRANPPRWDCIADPITDSQAAAGSTTSTLRVHTSTPVKYKMVGWTVFFRPGGSGNNVGERRTITAVSETTNAVELSAPLNAAPTAGDPISFGIAISTPTADAIIAICEAPVTAILRYWRDSAPPASVVALVAGDDQTSELVTGSSPGTWPSSGTAYGMEATGATLAQGMTLAGTVQFRAKKLLLTDGRCPDLAFEVKGIGAVTSDDASPADVVIDLLSHATHGAGLSSADIITDLGAKTVANPAGTAASSYRTYCQAMGFVVSRAVVDRTPASALLGELLDQTNATAVWSEGKLRIIPLGDTAITANGTTYTPPSGPVALGVDDFLAESGEDPITVQRKSDAEVWNTFSVTYQDRSADYSPVAVSASDLAHATVYGPRRASEVSGTWITTAAHAQALAAILVQRSISVRNTYRFRLATRRVLLEPMDLVSLTEPTLGLSAVPCRIKSITEAEDGTLDVEAYEWPAGAGTPVVVATQPYDGYAASAALTPTSGTAAASAAAGLAAAAATVDLENVLPASVTTDLVAPGSITENQRTSGSSNLWPNGTSETSPPTGYIDPGGWNAAEFGHRVTSPAGGGYPTVTAYAGSYFRELVSPANDTAEVNFGIVFPAAEGDCFRLSFFARNNGAQGSKNAYIVFRNAAGGWLGTAGNSPLSANLSSWTEGSCSTGAAPAGTVDCIAYFMALSGAGVAETRLWFDQIVVARVASSALIVDGLEWKSAALTAIARSNANAGMVWYRGNNTGAPVAHNPDSNGHRVSLFSYGTHGGSSTHQLLTAIFDIEIQPKLDTDNLDGLRYLTAEMWLTSGAGTNIDKIHVPLSDRRYANATASHADNKVRVRVHWHFVTSSSFGQSLTPFHFTGYVRVVLFHVDGYSSPVDFYVGGLSNGAVQGTQVTSSSYNLGGSSPPSGGGGGGGRACVAPETPVLMTPDGITAPIGKIRAGDLVWTRPEEGGEMGWHRIAAAELATNLRQRTTLRDGRSFISSINHLIRVQGIWRRADSLEAGDFMDGQPGGIVERTEYLGEGPVVRLTIPTARTFFGGDGLWQHNAMKP